MKVRRYGKGGPRVAVIHGGPGAPGSMAPLARALETAWQVIEPLQRLAEREPLTVKRHVEDLGAVLAAVGSPLPLVGHSWGAMLSLCCAARYPEMVTKVVLIGCGTWSKSSRRKLEETRRGRMTTEVEARMAVIEEDLACEKDPKIRDSRLQTLAELLYFVDCYDPETTSLEVVTYDSRGGQETWRDMVRLQEQGVYPAELRGIRCPVVMLHGDHDPHPGREVQVSLSPYVRDLTYHEIAACGHYPWFERQGKKEFFHLLGHALHPEDT